MFIDPQHIARPVSHLSWSSGQDLLAATYSFGEFQEKPHDVSLHSYIWDIGTRIHCFRVSSHQSHAHSVIGKDINRCVLSKYTLTPINRDRNLRENAITPLSYLSAHIVVIII